MDLMSALCSSKEFLISSWLRCTSRLCELPSVDHGKPSDMVTCTCSPWWRALPSPITPVRNDLPVISALSPRSFLSQFSRASFRLSSSPPALPPSPRFSYSDETAAEKRNEESGTCSMQGVDVQAGIDLCTAAPALAASAERQECQHHTLPISLPLSSPSTGPGKAGLLGVLHVHGFDSSCVDQPTKTSLSLQFSSC